MKNVKTTDDRDRESLFFKNFRVQTKPILIKPQRNDTNRQFLICKIIILSKIQQNKAPFKTH